MANISERLATIQNEVRLAENQKLQCEQTLGLFWEHLPPIDPEVLARRMPFLRDRIRALEDRKRALLNEEQDLIVQAANLARNDQGD